MSFEFFFAVFFGGVIFGVLNEVFNVVSVFVFLCFFF